MHMFMGDLPLAAREVTSIAYGLRRGEGLKLEKPVCMMDSIEST